MERKFKRDFFTILFLLNLNSKNEGDASSLVKISKSHEQKTAPLKTSFLQSCHLPLPQDSTPYRRFPAFEKPFPLQAKI